MIVTPTTDVVLDVLQAADPVAQRAATAKLDALKSAAADFSTMQSEVGKAAAADGQAAADAELGASNMNAPGTFKAAASGDVYRKFEAFVLQVFVETMLPQQTQELFGKGTAGNVWRSMLAEQLGNQLAQGKGIGIAKQLAAAHPAARNDSGKAE